MIYALLVLNIILNIATLAGLILSNTKIKSKQQIEIKQEQPEEQKTEAMLTPIEDPNIDDAFALTKTLQNDWYNLTSNNEGE